MPPIEDTDQSAEVWRRPPTADIESRELWTNISFVIDFEIKSFYKNFIKFLSINQLMNDVVEYSKRSPNRDIDHLLENFGVTNKPAAK